VPGSGSPGGALIYDIDTVAGMPVKKMPVKKKDSG
jgi:hypothetical protein